jgi:hypothetical protein
MHVSRPDGVEVPDDGAASASAQGPADPTAALIAALDRLRATDELRSVETELMRAMGARHYQEESRHGLPVIADPSAPAPPPNALPPDQVG